MQTFLPHRVFAACAEMLDDKRLRKQCVESYQIIDTILHGKKAWSNHPAVNMWRGGLPALCCYTRCMCDEYESRFGKPILSHKFAASPVDMRNALDFFLKQSEASSPFYPSWWADRDLQESVILSHRSNLLRKDPQWYKEFGWTVPDNLPYVWPATGPVAGPTVDPAYTQSIDATERRIK